MKDIKKQIIVNALFIQIEMFQLGIIEHIQPIVYLNDLILWKEKLNEHKTREENFIMRINLVISLMRNDKINIKEIKII